MIDEEQIDNMSYLLFEDILEELGRKLNFEAISNYAGNGFVEKSWDMIMESNPMTMGDGKHLSGKQKNDMAAFFGGARTVKKGDASIPRPPRKG